jgi:L-malate glycosyltransferase
MLKHILRRLIDYLRNLFILALCYSGLNKMYCYVMKMSRSGNGIRILAYHDIGDGRYLNLSVPEKVFKMHIEFLIKNKYNIISLKRAVAMLKTGERVPDKTVVITFDDGYKSMLTSVYPLVKQYQIPIAIFLSVGPLETGRPLFVDMLRFAFEKTFEKKLDLTSLGLQQYTLDTNSERMKAIADINNYGKQKCNEIKEQIIASVFAALKIDIEDPRLKSITLNWNEVAWMNQQGITFGAHTVSHPVLANVCKEDARIELSESKRIIELNIGENVDFFAYPFGSRDCYTLEIRKMVEENKFTAACVLTSGMNKAGEDLFLLKRTNITYSSALKPNWFFVRPHFSVMLSGSYEWIAGMIKNAIKKGKMAGQVKNSQVNNGKINILFLIDSFNGPGAGTERHLRYLASKLDKSKFRCLICYFDGNDVLANIMEGEGIPTIYLPLKRIYGLKAVQVAFKITKIIKENNIDIVQTYHFKSDTYGVLVSKLAGVKKIISSRRDTGDLKKPRQILLNRLVNRFIDHFIMVSDKVGRKITGAEKIDSGRIDTIYNGVDLNKYSVSNNGQAIAVRKELSIPLDAFVIGTTAVFRPEKGYDIFLEGIRRICNDLQNWKVLLIGGGNGYEKIRSYCSDLGLEHNVIFLGYRKDVERYLEAIDVFCLIPKNNEGFSNAILEAMAMGRPIIASDVGGNAEAVVHNETGLIIPPNDSQHFAEAVIEMYKNPVMRATMGKKARIRSENAFSLDQMVKKHENLYIKIMGSKAETTQCRNTSKSQQS